LVSTVLVGVEDRTRHAQRLLSDIFARRARLLEEAAGDVLAYRLPERR
jgi:hypothetical protein